MTREKKFKAMTAAELARAREARIRTDPDYRDRVEAGEKARAERKRFFTRAEEPIVRDLQAAGIHVASVWDLVNTSTPYPGALPILLEHLERRTYPDRVREGLARAMAVKPAAFAWDSLCELYLVANGRDEREGLAVALAASATERHFERLSHLLSNESLGESRLHLLRAIKRVGARRGRDLIAGLQDDPLFQREARRLTRDS